jgi:hypothetical protein
MIAAKDKQKLDMVVQGSVNSTVMISSCTDRSFERLLGYVDF